MQLNIKKKINNPNKKYAAAAAKSLQSWPTLRPHRRKPTRLPRPWDSLGKNSGVGCHFLLQCMKVESEKWSCSVVSDSWWPHGLQPTRLLCPWDFPGKSTRVGCHCLLCIDYVKYRQCRCLIFIQIKYKIYKILYLFRKYTNHSWRKG